MADEDDYMSEAFMAQFEEAEKASKKSMTYSERRRQKEKEYLANRLKSHKELEHEARAKGLETELGEENKGMQMLLKMGFQKGGTLGASSTKMAHDKGSSNSTPPAPESSGNQTTTTTGSSMALRVPLAIEIKQGRGGLGMDTLLKEQEERMLKEKQAFDENFRERKGDQYMQDKYHRQLTRAQSLCMELDTAQFRRMQAEDGNTSKSEKEEGDALSNEGGDGHHEQQSVQQNQEGEEEAEKHSVEEGETRKHHPEQVPANSSNDVEEGEKIQSRGNAFWWIADEVPDDIIGTRAMGRPAELTTPSAELSSDDDTEPTKLGSKRLHQAELSGDDKQEHVGPGWMLSAVKKRKLESSDVQEEMAKVDTLGEMEQSQPEERKPLWGEYPEFASLEVKEKRDKVVEYLRKQHAYCFWCHAQYANQVDLQDHCPGPSEDDH